MDCAATGYIVMVYIIMCCTAMAYIVMALAKHCMHNQRGLNKALERMNGADLSDSSVITLYAMMTIFAVTIFARIT